MFGNIFIELTIGAILLYGVMVIIICTWIAIFKYLGSLPPKTKFGGYFVLMTAGGLLMVTFNYFFFTGTPIGEAMLGSLVGFSGFGLITGLLYLHYRRREQAAKENTGHA